MATALYAALCGPILIFLSIRVIKARRGDRVAIGGGTPALDRARSVQGNFIEYVPLTLILMGLAELQGVSVWFIHAAGAMLIACRLLHAFGVSQAEENFRFRIAAMQGTFLTLVFCSGLSLYGFLLSTLV